MIRRVTSPVGTQVHNTFFDDWITSKLCRFIGRELDLETFNSNKETKLTFFVQMSNHTHGHITLNDRFNRLSLSMLFQLEDVGVLSRGRCLCLAHERMATCNVFELVYQ